MARTLIQEHSSAIVKALIERSKAIKNLKHKVTKGQLRELFVANILNLFLTEQFGIGSGVIINSKGDESNQTDIIIYDNRILPPFIQEQNVGVYPIESVMSTIEVKSWLRKDELLKAEKAAKRLRTKVCDPTSNYLNEEYKPLTVVIGFYGTGVKELQKQKTGEIWLKKNINYLLGICLVNQYSWMVLKDRPWRMQKNEQDTNEEVKRFIAVHVDNIRTKSRVRMDKLSRGPAGGHKDFLSQYIRH